jgi:O-antigen biosynthesis protein
MENVFKKLMPWGTRRRYYCQLGFSAIKIIRQEGWRAFCSKAGSKINRALTQRSRYSYNHWIIRFETDQNALEKQKSLTFKYSPKISIITPVWNPKSRWLKASIESVIQQTYPNWELCLAYGGSSKPEVIQVLKEYAQKDSRIKTKFINKNLGISGNSNEALSLASGEFIALLDLDDELAPFALFEVVKVLNKIPDLDYIYSDEDKLNKTNKRIEPFFKPDWSPDYFLSCMYTCHLGIYRKNIIDEIGGFRSYYDGSQNYDLVLRVIEKTQNIYHISEVLYHRRISRLVANDEKSKSHIAAKKALTDYMLRNYILGEILDGPSSTTYRLKRQIIANPLVSIIIPTKDKANVLKGCIESILTKTDYTNYEIIIVDNQSVEQRTFDYYKSISTISKMRILNYNDFFNYSTINNYAASLAKGEHLLFLNNDTEVLSREWLSSMLEHSQRNEVGAVGAKLLFRNKSIQHCGVIIGLGGVAGHPCSRLYKTYYQGARPSVISNYSAVTGACLMLRKSVFDEVGGFDTRLAIGFNDIDLCLKIRELKYLIVYTPYALLFHYESLTRGYDDEHSVKKVRYKEECDFMHKRWGDIIDRGDPYYNPNLSLEKCDFSLKLNKNPSKPP